MVQLPREILEQAVKLRNCNKTIYLALYSIGKPSRASVISELVDIARPIVNVRLNTLVDMGLVRKTKDPEQKRAFLYEVITC